MGVTESIVIKIIQDHLSVEIRVEWTYKSLTKKVYRRLLGLKT